MVNKKHWQVEFFEGSGDSYIFIVPGDVKEEAEQIAWDLLFAMSELKDVRIEKTVIKMFFSIPCHFCMNRPEDDSEE